MFRTISLPFPRPLTAYVATERDADHILSRSTGPIIDLGDCPTGSFLVSDFLGFVGQFDFKSMKPQILKHDLRPGTTVLIRVTAATDYNEIERLNHYLQSIPYQTRCIILIDPLEHKSDRVPPSFFSRVVPHLQRFPVMTAVPPKFPPPTSSAIRRIDIPVDPLTWLHETSFQPDSQSMTIRCTFQDHVTAHIGPPTSSPIVVTFHVKELLSEYSTVFSSLNRTKMLPFYGIDLRDYPGLHFECRILASDIHSRLKLAIDTDRFSVQSPDPTTTVEVTDINVDYLINGGHYLRRNDRHGYEMVQFPVPQNIYVASRLSDDSLLAVLDWLDADPSHHCTLGDYGAIGMAHLGQSLDVPPCDTVTITSLLAMSKPFALYGLHHTPSAILNDRRMADTHQFIVSDIWDVASLRTDIALYPDTPFFMTPSAVAKLTQYGPLLLPQHVTEIADLDSLHTQISQSIPGIADWLSDITVLRTAFVMHRCKLSIEQATQIAIVHGLPPHLRPEGPSIDVPAYLDQYRYSNQSHQGFAVGNTCEFSTFSKLPLARRPSVICVAPVSPDADADIQLALNAGGIFRIPIWHVDPPTVAPIESPKTIEDAVSEVATRLAFDLVIGSQQRKMIHDILSDIHALREASIYAVPFKNTRFLVGAAGTGKDELCKFIHHFGQDLRLVRSEVFNPLRLDEYLEAIASHSTNTTISVFNFQEINLSEDGIDAFETVALAAAATPKIYIIATGNDFDIRLELTPDLDSLVHRTSVGPLSTDDIRTAIHRFSTGLSSDIQDQLFQHFEFSVHQSKINFRLIRSVCDLVRVSVHEKATQRSNERKQKMTLRNKNAPEFDLDSIFPIQHGARRTGRLKKEKKSDPSAAIQTNKKSFFNPWTFSIWIGMLAILIQFVAYPWLPIFAQDTTPSNPDFPLTPTQTQFDTPFFKSRFDIQFPIEFSDSMTPEPYVPPRSLRRGRLPTIFRSQLDERLNCSRLPGRDGLILDVVGTITTTSNARFGHLGQIDSEYMRNILSRFKELRIEKPVEVYGLPMPPDLRVSPFNLPDAVAHETRGTIQNRLGVPLYDTVMNRLAEAPTLDHKISVIQSFIETYFRYDLNATNFSPTRDPLWLSAFLRHQIGVCEHFSRFAQLLLALDQPGTRVASVEVLACDSNQLHEKLLIEDRSSTRFIEMTPPDRAQSLLSQCFSALRQFLPSSSTPLSREFFETFTRDCKILENTDLFRSVFHESNLPKIIDRIVQGERNALNALANKFNEEVKSLTSLVEPLETVTGSRQAKRETDWRNIFTISDAIIVLSPYIFKLLMALISPGIVRLLAKVSPVRQPEDYFSTLRLTGHVRRMGLLIPHKPGPKDWANWRMVRFAKIAETFTPTRLLTQSAIDQLGLTLSDVASAFVAQTARVQLVSTPALIPALRKEVAYHYLGLIGDTTLVPCGATSVVGAPELVMRVDKERTKEELEPKIAAFLNSIFERFTDLNSVVIDRDQYSTMSLLAFAVLYEPKMIYELARRGYRMDMDFDIRQVISAAKVTEESSLHAAGTYRIRAALKALIELGYPLDRDTRRTSSETTSLLCKYLRLESDDSPLVSALIAAGHPISTAADHMKHSSTGALYNWVYNRDDGTIFSAMSISGRFDQPDIGMQSLDGGRKDGPLYSSLERLIKNRDFFGGLIHVLAADYPVAMDPGNQPNRITLLDRAILNMDLEAATWLAQRGAIISSPRSFFAFVTDKGENSTGIWGWLITRDLKLVALCMQAIYRRFTMANSNSATLS